MKKHLFCLASFAALAACAVPEATTSPEPSAEAPDGAIRAVPMPAAPLDQSKTVNRIVFGSCAHQNEDQSIWDLVASQGQDLTLYFGDNVYGDVRSRDAALPELKAAYMRLSQSAPFARARAAAPMLTMWDDHDYGDNDEDGDYEHKEKSEALFEYVWDIKDERAERPGVYGSWVLGEEEGKRVQIIMLDTRFFRSGLMKTDEWGAPGKERYIPDADPEKTMLGDAQWDWFAQELKKPADLRLVVSSVQVIADGHGWEAWKMLPTERERFYEVIDEVGAKGVILLSGDRHAAALYSRDDVISYPLVEATSSSLNLPGAAWRARSGETYIEPGPYRTSDMIYDANFGAADIDWEAGAVTLSIIGEDGETITSEIVELASLR